MGNAELTPLQIDILELERGSFSDSAKLSTFKDKHPDVGPVRYTAALLALLNNPAAWEHDNRRFAPTLARIQRLHQERLAARGAARGVEPE
jgi:hypothetical protein